MRKSCVGVLDFDRNRRNRINALILEQIRENQNFIDVKGKKYGKI